MTDTVVEVAGADTRRATRWFAALLLPIGPAAVALLRYFLPYDTADAPATIVGDMLAQPGRMSFVLWMGFVAILTLVPAVYFVGRLTRRRAPRLTAAALVLLVPGYLALPWLASSDYYVWAGGKAGLDAGAITRMYETIHPTVDVAGVVFVLGHVLGTVLLGVALWRARVVGRWAAVCTIVSQPIHLAAVIVASHTLDLFGWGLQAVGFAAVGWAILRLRDDDWDLPPLR
ncbi:hypothetical protein OG394_20785 [Kribbella sp. NBC_01245]|uniref:hypothetical protein n=1 Tax=Kribbella sp. NBC_01245 TaxID=2903578 RepID=UPI002E2B5447|nr:hypothetical protein [Kribbella sp. NBC_01245]